MKLFDEFERTDFDYSSHSESTYNFYNRTGINRFIKVRELLEKWFSFYDKKEQKELKRRFQTDFNSAFYELFLYTLLLSSGCEVEIHPTIPLSSKKPDFLAKKGDFSAYIEARVVNDITASEETVINLKSRIYDKINEIKSAYFFISIDELVIIDQTRPPSLKKINKFIENTLNDAEHNLIKKNLEEGIYKMSYKIYQDIGVKLVISLIPKNPSSIRKESKLIGLYADQGKAQIVNPSISIKKALDEKAKRYGQVDRPFIIAINALSNWITDKEDYVAALFGNDSIIFDSMSNIYQSVRGTDGFFKNENGYRYSRVSGILFTRVYPTNVFDSQISIYHNPTASKPLNTDFLKVQQYYVEENKLQPIEGLTTISILGI